MRRSVFGWFALALGLFGAAAAAPAATPAPATAAAAATAATTATAAAATPAAQGQLLDRVVAVVNDGVVLQSELDQQTAQISARLQAQNVALPDASVLRKQVLDRLIIEQIEDQHADRAGIKVSDEQINAALADVAKRQNISFDQLPEALAAQGYNYADYRTDLRREIAREILQGRDVVQRINITPRELDEYMERARKTASDNIEYNASHILIPVVQDATPEQLSAASKQAQDIVKRARAGEDFARLALTYSKSETALEGGSLGWRKGTALPTFLADVIARMKPGEVSDPVQTSSGFHIVKLNSTRASGGPQMVHQYHLRHILIKTTALQDDATVRGKLARMRQQILAGKEDFAVLAKTGSDDPGSAVNGGDLGWTTLDTFVPQFAAAARQLKTNEISEPFRTQYGWHIVQLLGQRDFDNTATAERDRAYTTLRDSRVEEATDLWLQQLRDESYIDIRL